MRFVAFALMIFAQSSAYAGLFGAASYEECVLDKMKGQAAGMIGMAKDACRKEFPIEPETVLLDKNLVKYTWCEQSQTKQTVCISEQESNVKITRVEALLFTDKCELKQRKSGIEVVGKKSILRNEYYFETPPDNYGGCAVFTFYGHKK